jgi:hypothetical protein
MVAIIIFSPPQLPTIGGCYSSVKKVIKNLAMWDLSCIFAKNQSVLQ